MDGERPVSSGSRADDGRSRTDPTMAHVFALGLLMVSFPDGALADATLPEPTRETFNCTADGSRWPYLVQAPSGDVAAVLIYLHGHYADEYQGMTLGSYNDAFGKLRHECLARGWAYVTAWYGGNTWMGPYAERGLVDLIRILRTRWPNRPVYLCGGSMGGSSTLVFAVRRPDLLDGAIALCPAADIRAYYASIAESPNAVLRNIASAIAIHYQAGGHSLEEELFARSALLHADRLTMPVYLSHGAADATIPVEPTRALAGQLRDLGRAVKYLEIPNGDHDSPVTQVNWTEALDFVAGRATD
jgi:pimeloyl-ACP methyl ester carboxylesterase